MVAVTIHSGVRCAALPSLHGLDLFCFVRGAGFFDRNFLRASSSSEAPLKALHRLLTVYTCKQSSITIQTPHGLRLLLYASLTALHD